MLSFLLSCVRFYEDKFNLIIINSYNVNDKVNI